MSLFLSSVISTIMHSPHSLQSLIPDIKPALGQDAVLDLHPEEMHLSEEEEEGGERGDQDLKIRRTVTQVHVIPRLETKICV